MLRCRRPLAPTIAEDQTCIYRGRPLITHTLHDCIYSGDCTRVEMLEKLLPLR